MSFLLARSYPCLTRSSTCWPVIYLVLPLRLTSVWELSDTLTIRSLVHYSLKSEMLSFWWNFHHWLHWKLSEWQLRVHPVMIILSKWRHSSFNFVDCLYMYCIKYSHKFFACCSVDGDITSTYSFLCGLSLCQWHIDGWMQERRNSIANTLELRLSCINPLIYVLSVQLKSSSDG